jgi:hypothetical protein
VIVIHIGLKKAGSTSIQAFMACNDDALRQLGVDYAQVGRKYKTTHHNFAREIITSLKKFRPDRGTISELADYWRKAAAGTLVLSSELFEEAEVDQIGGMRDTLRRARLNEEFRIVLIVRNLLDLIPSSYAQKVKYGVRTCDFDAFFEERMQLRRVNHFATAKRWADAFGWDSLHIRVLDRSHLVNGDLLDDFLSLCNLDRLSAEAVPLVRPPRILNQSPGWKVLESTRALFGGNHGLPSDHPLSVTQKLKDRMIVGNVAIRAGDKRGWNNERGLYLTREQADRCVELFEASVDNLNAHLANPLPLPRDLEAQGFSPREFLPEARLIPADELEAFYEDMRSILAKRKEHSEGARKKRKRKIRK